MVKVRIRSRDFAPRPEVVQLEKVVTPDPVDLSGVEAKLRANEVLIQDLKAALERRPRVNYTFKINRDKTGRISSVDADAHQAPDLSGRDHNRPMMGHIRSVTK